VGERQTKIVLRSAEPEDVQPMLDRLRQEQRVIVQVKPVRETLEDLFMRAVSDPTTGKPRQVGAATDAGGRRP
jgi:hypothetical protein